MRPCRLPTNPQAGRKSCPSRKSSDCWRKSPSRKAAPPSSPRAPPPPSSPRRPFSLTTSVTRCFCRRRSCAGCAFTYQRFAEALANPTHLSLFKVEPLRGIGVLEIHPRLGLTMVDRLLGGPAHSITPDHDFSEIEMALLDQAVHLILAEWCNHWASVQELRPVLLGHENNGQFLQTAPRDTIMLVLTMEAKLGDCLEQVQLVLPCFTLEPLIRKLSQATEVAEQESRTTVVAPGAPSALKSPQTVQPYDFRHPVFLSPPELRRLRMVIEYLLWTLQPISKSCSMCRSS